MNFGVVQENTASSMPNFAFGDMTFGSRSPGETGHVFNVVNQNGVIRYLDGQTGVPTILDGYTGFRLLRTN